MLKYIDITDKIRSKTIFFGDKDVAEFIDHKNEEMKRVALSKIRGGNDPFEKNFYRVHILNGRTTDITKNYALMVTSIKVSDKVSGESDILVS